MSIHKKRTLVTTSSTDQEIWQSVKHHHCKHAFSVLFERYWSILYTTAFSYLKDSEKSEEITHDILLNLWRKRETLNIQSFTAYLRTAARYHVYKERRTRKELTLSYTDDWEQVQLPGVINAGIAKIYEEETSLAISRILQTLPARCREIFVLSRMEHLSNDEIAQRLGISKRSVENQITQALQSLRVHLKILTTLLLLFIGR